ncbi:MAG: radical SAM protein [bacterium]
MSDMPASRMSLRQLLRKQLQARYGRKVRGLSEEAGPPRILMLESSAACNLSCPKCAHKSAPRKRGNMDLELGFSIIEQAAAMGTRWVCLSLLGEPLLNPDLEEFVLHARSEKLNPYLVTNGMLLTPERSEALLEAGLAGAVVSIDGWDPASWEERQPGVAPELVMQNLAAFRKLTQKKDPTPELASISIIDTISKKHLKELKTYLGPAVDRCGILPLMDFGTPDYRTDPALLPGRRSWMMTPCRNLWDTLNVGWDGRVTACCNDHGFLLEYGDAARQPLAEIWNNRTMQSYRKNHLTKNLSQMPMCGSCTQDFEKSLRFGLWRYRFSRM